MEIQQVYKYQIFYNLFKIDLIVWKLLSQDKKTLYTTLFKIDLIVWKWRIKKMTEEDKFQFKIDLIVWKFFILVVVIYVNFYV